MSVFLVLSSSALAFYLFVLLALYRDNHKRRSRRNEAYSNVWLNNARGPKVSHSAGYLPGRRSDTSDDDVLWIPVTRVRLKRRPAEGQLLKNSR